MAASEDGSPWWVYMLRCADGSLYTGITTNLERRLAEHNGEVPGGARYTRPRRPVTLVYREVAEDRSSATRREMQIKAMTRVRKEALLSATVL